MSGRARTCVCKGDFWPDTGERIVTVGCPVHHLMADGEPAADHETSCMCGNFVDARECAEFINTDEGGAESLHVCAECVPWANGESHLHAVPEVSP